VAFFRLARTLTMRKTAEHWSLTYGLVCVALALLLGWGASAAFQRRYA